MDLAILDLNLPDADTGAIVNYAMKKEIPTIVLTATANEKLKDISEINFMKVKNKNYQPNYYAFSITFNNRNKEYRNEFIQKLKNRGIGSSVYYPKPIPEMLYYKKKYSIKEKFFNSKIISYNSLVLPIGQHIKKSDIDYISNNIKKIIYETK